MTVTDLKNKLNAVDGELEVVVLEGKKHYDDCPLLTLVDAEQSCTNGDDEVFMITVSPNPDTILRKHAVGFAFWIRDNAVAVVNGAWIHNKLPYNTSTLFNIYLQTLNQQ